MKINLLAFAVPLFLLFMGIEYLVARQRKVKVHQMNESIANINVGIAERLSDLFTTGIFFGIFNSINQHFAIIKIGAGVINWVLLFLVTDLVWYWYHRLGHKVNLFWGVHIVHHQSEDFNYTASVRVTFFQAIIRGAFWCVLPLIGFPPHMVVIILLIHGAYPFFTHTRLIGKLGWLEYVIVTPSHHRVHHSSNPQYLDKNFGDVLIIWDKIFGTFEQEEEEPRYGITKPLKSCSFLWQHFHFMLEMFVAFKCATSFKEKLRVIAGNPSDISPAIRPLLEKKYSKKAANVQPTSTLRYFIKVQTAITLFVLFGVILFEFYFTWQQLVIASLFILLSVINTGAMIEQRSWIFSLDFFRLALIGIAIHSIYPSPAFAAVYAGGLLLILVFYKTINTQYFQILYKLSP